MESKRSVKIYIIPILIIALLTAIDQLTKFIITGKFVLFESRPVIKDVFSITYIQNRGLAWGMFQGGRVIFLIITVFVLFFCFYLYSNICGIKKYFPLRIGLVVLLSGAIGNMIDRIKLGYVIDFLDFELINFPVFNVADVYVTVSMFFIIILLFFKYDNDDFEEILSGKRKDID